MFNFGISDGRVYLTAMVQNPNSHFPQQQTIDLTAMIEQAVRKVVREEMLTLDKGRRSTPNQIGS